MSAVASSESVEGRPSPRMPRRPTNTRVVEEVSPAHAQTPKVFGGSLVRLKEQTGRDLPLIISTALPWLEASGRLRTEGLFRVSGGAAEVDELKSAYNNGINPLGEYNTTHSLAPGFSSTRLLKLLTCYFLCTMWVSPPFMLHQRTLMVWKRCYSS